MKIFKQIFGLSPAGESKDIISQQMEMDDDLLEWGYKANQSYVQARIMEAKSEWGFQTSQIAPLEWRHSKISCRCAWCGRKVFENQVVCSGCGAYV